MGLTRGVVLCFSAALGSAVAAGTGTIEGEVDGQAFTAPVECDMPTAKMFTARTPGMGFAGSSTSKVIPAADVTVWSGRLAAQIFVGDQRYQFGSTKVEQPTDELSYEGTIRSKKRGEYKARFVIRCGS